jgi:hypothetical protein
MLGMPMSVKPELRRYPETGEEVLGKQRAKRKAASLRIIQNVDLFTLCDGCLSIHCRSISICPVCYGYRFDEDAERIISVARIAGERAMAWSEPVILRFRMEGNSWNMRTRR